MFSSLRLCYAIMAPGQTWVGLVSPSRLLQSARGLRNARFRLRVWTFGGSVWYHLGAFRGLPNLHKSGGGSPPDLSGNLYPCTDEAFFRFLTLRNFAFFVFSGSQFLIPKFLIRLLGCIYFNLQYRRYDWTSAVGTIDDWSAISTAV